VRIGILSEPPRLRSPFKAGLEQARGLAERGHRVYFVVQKRNLDATACLLGGLPQNINYLALQSVPIVTRALDFFTKSLRYVEGGVIDVDLGGMLVSGWCMSKKLFKIRLDSLLSYSTLSPLQMFNLYSSRELKKVLYLFDMPIYIIMMLVNPKVNAAIVQFVRRFEESVIRRADIILCATRGAALIWKKLYGVDSVLLRFGCQPSSTFSHSKGDYMVSITSWEPQRNPLFLLDVMRALDKTDLRLIVAGKWQDKSLYEQFRFSVYKQGLQKKVIIARNLDDQELTELYRKAVCFIQPAGSGTLYKSALEAASQGVPMILPSQSELWEMFESGMHGFRVIENNVQSYVDAISRLSDEDVLYKMSYETWKRCGEYSWNNHAAMLEKFLE
jgi:glycosyltransferase involved in cell wall biosynthesis